MSCTSRAGKETGMALLDRQGRIEPLSLDFERESPLFSIGGKSVIALAPERQQSLDSIAQAQRVSLATLLR